ncbi:MAG: hypothetical protein WA874_13430 [Chryseosolibacter sp.]
MKDFVELENEFSDVKGDTLSTIRFFESNKKDIDNLDASYGQNRSFRLTLYGSYGISLAISGNTNKALTILDAFIPTFEKDLESYDDEYVKSPFYESLLWTYGYTLHDAKRYPDSELVFAKLIKLYPDNTKYKKWLAASKLNRYSTIRQTLWTACFLLLAIDILFQKSMEQGLSNAFWITVALTIITTLSLELHIYIIKKKNE